MYKNILLPVALDHEKDLGQALDIARRLGGDTGTLTIVHVAERIPGHVANELPETVVANVRKAMLKEIEEITKEAGPTSKWEILEGSAGQAIIDYAEANDIDCIVLSSHKPGLSDYFLGSTAARVVRHATCSVHVIR